MSMWEGLHRGREEKEDKGGGFVGMRDVERQFGVLTVKETATAEGGAPYDG